MDCGTPLDTSFQHPLNTTHLGVETSPLYESARTQNLVKIRLVVLSDIDANLTALERVLADIPSCDELYCLGDIVGYGPSPNEVIEVLRAHNPAVVLAENHDYAVVTGNWPGFVDHAAKSIQWTRDQLSSNNMSYLQALKPSARKRVQDTNIALFHGSPRDPLNDYVFPGTPSSTVKKLLRLSGAEILLQGHTHVSMFFREGQRVLLNPGSVGQPRDGNPRACYMVLDVETDKAVRKFKRVQYDIEETASRVLRYGLPGFLGERLSLGV